MVSGAMGFIRNQKKLAVKFLRWQYEKQKLPLPAESDLMTQTARIVDEAHRIATGTRRQPLRDHEGTGA